jgi:hypothetical protein
MALDGSETQLLSLINTFRTQNGRQALKPSPNLSRAAAWMSEDQTSHGTFSHTDSQGRLPFSRVQQCGYATTGAGENLALTGQGPQSAFTLWANSTAGHRENMLNASWVVAGIGHAGNIWTADFGSVDDSNQPWDSGSPPAPPPPPPPPSSPQPTQGLPTSTPTSIPAAAPPSTPLGITVPLFAGDNLVTYAGPEQPVLIALRSVTDRLVVVYEWEPGEQRWAKFSPGKPGYVNSFSTLKPGGVYSIQLTAGGAWSY